jgi:hypothetical protein
LPPKPEPEPDSAEDPLMFFLSFLFLLSRRSLGPRIKDVLMLDLGWVFLEMVGVEAMRVDFSGVQTARIWGDSAAGQLELIRDIMMGSMRVAVSVEKEMVVVKE